MVRLLYYLFDLIVAVVVWKIVDRAFGNLFGTRRVSNQGPRVTYRTGRASQSGPENPAIHGETARDPVCGMFVSTEVSHRLNSKGKTLHFCSQECLERYQRDVSHV